MSIANPRPGDQRLGVRVYAFSCVRTAITAALTNPDVDSLVRGVVRRERDHMAIAINTEDLIAGRSL